MDGKLDSDSALSVGVRWKRVWRRRRYCYGVTGDEARRWLGMIFVRDGLAKW